MIEPDYAELHCRSNFSFLQGASHPEELVQSAAALGYRALAITDHATLAGIVRAHGACKQAAADRADGASLRLVVGAALEPLEAAGLVVWAADRRGYTNLCRLLTRGHGVDPLSGDVTAPGGPVTGGGVPCRITVDDVAAHAEGLLAGVPLAALWDGAAANVPAALEAVGRWREVFGERLCCLAEVAREGDDAARLAWYGAVARQARVPVVAAGDVRCHVRARLPLLHALTAVRHGATIEEIRGRLVANGERHLHERLRIAERFAPLPGAVARSVEWAGRCTFTLDELRYEYPESVVPPGRTPQEHLGRMVWKGARQRYPDGVPEKVRRLIGHELALVAELGYEAYFLTVFDIVRFARRRGILCQGRGSAANSAICYCLGITSVDPARLDVLFERFISRERREAPDIDVDFEHQRREEVLQYVYRTYGRTRAAMTAEVICYRLRSAVRDMGKVLGLSLDRVARIAEVLDVADGVGQLPARLTEAGLSPTGATGRRLVALVGQLVGFPRHLGQHVGGMVMTRGALCDLVPIQPATMDGRTVVQWDKNDLDELGILKVDCLALGMLTAIHRAFDLVAEHGGPQLTLATVPAEDPEVYEMISQADTVGVFQIESRAQMSMLPRLRPRCFYDLVIEVAIVRPGPIQGDMVHPYLRRRAGEEPVDYPSDAIREVLEKTLGVPLFQEQAMRLAVVAAGFTPGEADQLRRAMGAWRRPGVIDEFHRRLVDGMRARGLSEEFAERVFNQIRGFGEYGFPESHAASFALLVYVSAWLKRHHPAAFTAALLGSQPMGFYAPAQLVRDARQHGVTVLPVDVNASGWHAGLERLPRRGQPGPAIRLGLEQVHGLGEEAGRRIEAARRQGAFRLVHELARRARLDREHLLHLARAGALESLGLDRRRAAWEAMRQVDRPEERPLFAGLGAADEDEVEADAPAGGAAPFAPHASGLSGADAPAAFLPALAARDEVIADYRAVGLSLAAHPLAFERAWLAERGVVTAALAAAAPEGRRVCVAGIVLVRQRPATASGMIFLTVEDETGAANVVVRPAVWEAADPATRRAAVLLVHGRIQRRGAVVHLLATRLEPAVPGRAADGADAAPRGVAATKPALPRMSRDFR
ncbi:MAG: DNA polymerase III subunit alpha [Planctomycetes bacterium]|nr:DNA polymerase III subunit alpha [Planctomycetota bacterium]